MSVYLAYHYQNHFPWGWGVQYCFNSLVGCLVLGAWNDVWHIVGLSFFSCWMNEFMNEWGDTETDKALQRPKHCCSVENELKYTSPAQFYSEPDNRSALTQIGNFGLIKLLGKIDPREDLFPPLPPQLRCTPLPFTNSVRCMDAESLYLWGCLGTWSCSLCFHLEFLIPNFQEQQRPCWEAHT